MALIKILIQGYTSADAPLAGEVEKTCATITLVRDNNLVIVVDPGILENQQMLVDELKKEGLMVSDVNMVFLTHSHIDHYRNVGMFPTAKTLEYYGLWDKNTVVDWQEQLTENIKIIKTPGHSYTGLTMLVKTDEGVVAICGDVFWKENYPEDDPYADDKEKLVESRKKIIEMTDYIIPGHAGMYKEKK